jgi:cell division protein FtsB
MMSSLLQSHHVSETREKQIIIRSKIGLVLLVIGFLLQAIGTFTANNSKDKEVSASLQTEVATKNKEIEKLKKTKIYLQDSMRISQDSLELCKEWKVITESYD